MKPGRKPLTDRETALVRMAPRATEPDVLTPPEVMGRFGLKSDAAYQALDRAVRRGLLVRVRPGAYRRAPETNEVTTTEQP